MANESWLVVRLVLFRGKQQGLAKRVVPGAQNLP
jgi:hypothetical protein